MRPPFSLNFIEWGLGQKYFVLNHWKKKEERMSMEKGGKPSFSNPTQNVQDVYVNPQTTLKTPKLRNKAS